MRVVDETTGQLIAEADEASSAWARFRGLMLQRHLDQGEGLIIRPCGSIHMMFMRFRIDAVFYDNEFRVTKVARNLRPWAGISFGGRGAKGVIELPAGSAAAVVPGHQLTMAA